MRVADGALAPRRLVSFFTTRAQTTQRSESKKGSGPDRTQLFPFLSGSVASVFSVVQKLTLSPSSNDLFDAREQVAVAQGDRHVVTLVQAGAAS